MTAIVVTGTDTGIGKTVFAAGLTAALNAQYWKPVQAGLSDATDTETVVALTDAQALPEAYRLKMPASPHLAAEDMGIEIDPIDLVLPFTEGPLVVEGAGGVMVPLTRRIFFLDVMAGWNAPVVLVARTALGTINHTALSLKALRDQGCDVVGVAFVGDAVPEVEQTIVEMCDVAHLGRLPFLENLSKERLSDAFHSIDVGRIRGYL